jgi:hypothetical protein
MVASNMAAGGSPFFDETILEIMTGWTRQADAFLLSQDLQDLCRFLA